MADRGDAARRLDHAAARHLSGAFALSRAALQRLVTEGRVRVNGVPASRPAQRLQAGDAVDLDVPPPPPRPAPSAERLPLEIVYEDDALLVVCKPPGLVAHPSYAHKTGTLLNGLLWHADAGEPGWQPRLVQRLDKDTSGLLVAAKSADVQTALQGARAGFMKEYLAIVWGRPVPARGTIDLRLGRDPLDRRRVMARDGGAEAVTQYHVLTRSRGGARGLSLVRCELVTGRTHQLRVHLAARGWPIVGDQTYGEAPRARLPDVALDRRVRAFGRQALHAWRLRFTHPQSGRVLQFDAPLPSDMAALVAAAGMVGALPRTTVSPSLRQ